MTRILKLVRHQNGSWQALLTEPEEALHIPFFDNKTDDAPIDPAQLLKALDPLLFDDCGVKEGSASQFSSLMKKFSRKLVSRCVYVNVLKVTKPEILEKLLEHGGWSTISRWLVEAEETTNHVFLIKLLELFKLLPITSEHLNEDDTINSVKSLTTHDNASVQTLSRELITKWMTEISEEDEVQNIIEKVEKPEKIHKIKTHKEPKDHKKVSKKDSPVKKKKQDKISGDIPKLKSRKRSHSGDSDLLDEVNDDAESEINGEYLPKKLKLSKSEKLSLKKFPNSNKGSKTFLKSSNKGEEVISKSELKLSPKSKLKRSPESQLKLSPKSNLKLLSKSELKHLSKSEVKLLNKSKSKPLLKSDSKLLSKSESKLSSKLESKLLSKSESKLTSKLESKLPSKLESKHPSKSESKLPSKFEMKPLHKSETKLLSKPVSKLMTKAETKGVLKSETKHISKFNSEHSPKSDTKSVKPEAKSALKLESKSELFHKKPRIDIPNKLFNKKHSHSAVYEDVKLDLKPDLPKNPNLERPKTVKIIKGKFRSTGLEEAPPLPKKIPKKVPTIDKTAAAVAAKNAVVKRLNKAMPEMITEKKIKPESLLNINEAPILSGGIKLIPAKPRPAHILQDSGFFMDALDAAREYPVKRKKKNGPKPIIKLAETAPPPTSPPASTPEPASSPIKPPKLQFYKDTLEMNTEETTKANEKETKEDSPNDETKTVDMDTEVLNPADDINNSNDTTEDGPVDESIKTEVKEDMKTEESSNESIEEERPLLPGEVRSILLQGKKNKRKKSVRWPDDDHIQQIHFFDMDETERVNVLRKTFGEDLKTFEAKREREFLEAAKRQANDKMEEATAWWIVPIAIKLPPPLVEPGCLSQEKETQFNRQRTILQAIYFTKDLLPDSATEPDPEFLIPHETKIVPVDEENVLGNVMDYTPQSTSPKPALPEVLTSLMNIPLTKAPPMPAPLNYDRLLPQNPAMMMQQQNVNLGPSAVPYDPAEPVAQGPTSAPPQINLLQQMPVGQPMFGLPQMPMMDSDRQMPIPNNMGAISPPVMMQDPQFFQNNTFPMNVNPFDMMIPNMPPMAMPMEPPPTGGGGFLVDRDEREDRRNIINKNNHHHHNNNMRPMHQNRRPMNHPNQPPFPRQQGPRGRGVPRVLCRHFAANGRCRFGVNCTFLHPGVNGPPL